MGKAPRLSTTEKMHSGVLCASLELKINERHDASYVAKPIQRGENRTILKELFTSVSPKLQWEV